MLTFSLICLPFLLLCSIQINVYKDIHIFLYRYVYIFLLYNLTVHCNHHNLITTYINICLLRMGLFSYRTMKYLLYSEYLPLGQYYQPNTESTFKFYQLSQECPLQQIHCHFIRIISFFHHTTKTIKNS